MTLRERLARMRKSFERACARYKGCARHADHVGRAGRAERNAGNDKDPLARVGEPFPPGEFTCAPRHIVNSRPRWRSELSRAAAIRPQWPFFTTHMPCKIWRRQQDVQGIHTPVK
jgi:hypothetical protein